MVKTRLPIAPTLALCLALAGTAAAQTEDFDLHDSAQYQSFAALLNNAGLTAANHAALFQHLGAARAKVSGPLAAATLKTANFIVDLATTDGDNFTATGVSTAARGSDYTLITLQLYDEKGTSLGPAASAEQIDQGFFVTATAHGTLGSVPGAKSVHAVLTTYVEPKGAPPVAQKVTVDGVVLPDQLTNDTPKAKKDPALIRVCVGKSAKNCDYSSTLLTRFPVKGKVVFPRPIDRIRYDKNGPTNATLTLLLADAANGGACTALSATSFFKTKAKITGKTLTWLVDPASFGACYPRDGRFVLAIGVKVKGAPALVSVADIETTATKTTVVIPPISVIRSKP
jgi:hypothetical protein